MSIISVSRQILVLEYSLGPGPGGLLVSRALNSDPQIMLHEKSWQNVPTCRGRSISVYPICCFASRWTQRIESGLPNHKNRRYLAVLALLETHHSPWELVLKGFPLVGHRHTFLQSIP